MTDNVRTIYGGFQYMEPDTKTIERLEMLLAEARAGGIQGISYSCYTKIGHAAYGHAGEVSYTLLAGLQMAQQNIVDALKD